MPIRIIRNMIPLNRDVAVLEYEPHTMPRKFCNVTTAIRQFVNS